MAVFNAMDLLVRDRLRQWPQHPPGLPAPDGKGQTWLRGRPGAILTTCHPFLKLPGSDRLRTLPDGLWLKFAGTRAEPFVDIFAVEACGSLPNLFDKRSRFAPSTHSMLAVCPLAWLLAPVTETDPTPRWQACGVLAAEPVQALVLPVRDIRVLYGLKPRHYQRFSQTQVPHPHEYFAPMEALTAAESHETPAMRELVARASTTANFMTTPERTAAHRPPEAQAYAAARTTSSTAAP